MAQVWWRGVWSSADPSSKLYTGSIRSCLSQFFRSPRMLSIPSRGSWLKRSVYLVSLWKFIYDFMCRILGSTPAELCVGCINNNVQPFLKRSILHWHGKRLLLRFRLVSVGLNYARWSPCNPVMAVFRWFQQPIILHLLLASSSILVSIGRGEVNMCSDYYQVLCNTGHLFRRVGMSDSDIPIMPFSPYSRSWPLSLVGLQAK